MIFLGPTPAGVLLKNWLKQRKEKRLLARILEKARKRLSRQNSTKKCVYSRTIIKIQQEVCEIEELVPRRKKTCFMQEIIRIYGTTAN